MAKDQENKVMQKRSWPSFTLTNNLYNYKHWPNWALFWLLIGHKFLYCHFMQDYWAILNEQRTGFTLNLKIKKIYGIGLCYPPCDTEQQRKNSCCIELDHKRVVTPTHKKGDGLRADVRNLTIYKQPVHTLL